jgi:methylmalonyl-CoA mutase N-terminal domain/subunit
MSGGTNIDISRKMEVDDEAIDEQLNRTRQLKDERDQEAVDAKLEAIRQATDDRSVNIFELVIEAIKAGGTNGEIVGVLWDEYGDSEDLVPTYAKGNHE